MYKPLGYGVIGNTGDSGSSILGSSPGTPAIQLRLHRLKRFYKDKNASTPEAFFDTLLLWSAIWRLYQMFLRLQESRGSYRTALQHHCAMPRICLFLHALAGCSSTDPGNSASSSLRTYRMARMSIKILSALSLLHVIRHVPISLFFPATRSRAMIRRMPALLSTGHGLRTGRSPHFLSRRGSVAWKRHPAWCGPVSRSSSSPLLTAVSLLL